jgi:hypothetical protein
MEWIPFSSEGADENRPDLPFITVSFYSDERDSLVEEVRALVDTGTNLSILPTDLINHDLGIKIGPEDVAATVGSGATSYRRTGEPFIHCLWNHHDVLIHPHASDEAPFPMLGLKDFLRHFVATFDSSSQQFALTPRFADCCSG